MRSLLVAFIPLMACAAASSVSPPSDDASLPDASIAEASAPTSSPGGDASPGRDATPTPDAQAPFDATAPDGDSASIDDAGLGAAVPLPALPLHTDSRWIVDAKGKRFKLASVNWYGAEELDHVVAGLDLQDVHAIARTIHALGFNAVRLPFSNELVELDPIIDDARLAANPGLKGKHALEVMDAVIAALAHEGIVVVLDDHTSAADYGVLDTTWTKPASARLAGVLQSLGPATQGP